jgi:hypothetical protein
MISTILRIFGRYMSPAERRARELFRATHPKSPIAWSTVKEEEEQFVVGVFFGSTRPPHYTFYSVSKGDSIATPIPDDAAYAPKNWR